VLTGSLLLALFVIALALGFFLARITS
jgi:hypothetical protein